ncbi:Hypothetical protein SRAE_1000119200 [Strongyloides ratti]|uniref:Transmembrane protein n=1 Tax=Strongyloides ratti TaxID=34506 RepID=A0A090KZG5_STRRB|nr:Hypothetical protein SRAE_1000119200 [Strongyloides ratti]CEF62925.1 Hypothetical protein SRAE_1000119200 [Strongyloides ratti]
MGLNFTDQKKIIKLLELTKYNMITLPKLEAEPRGATAQLSLVNGDSLGDHPNKHNSWQNVVTVTSSSTHDKTTRYNVPLQHSNVNPHSTSYDIDHGNNQNLSRQTSVSHLSNASYNINPLNPTTHINTNYDNTIKNNSIPQGKFTQQPLYSPYPSTSVASTTIHNPQREVKIRSPSVITDEKDRSKSTHSTHSSTRPISSNLSKNSKDSLTSNQPKRNRLQEFIQFLKINQKCCCTLLFLFFTIAIILTIVLCAVLIPKYQSVFNFQWAPPASVKGSGVVESTGVHLTIDDSNQQVRFDMTGHVPFKANYVSVYDFKTNKAIIYDPSLKNGTKTLYCFVMSFGSDKIKDISELRKAAHNTRGLSSQSTGWEEHWNYIPQNANNILQVSYVNPGIPECNGAKLVELKSVGTNQKSLRCTDCFDFCLPEYGIENDLIKSQSKLNILSRMCFYFFVPEWQSFAQGYNINNVNPNLNKPQFSSYQFNGNVQNIPYSTNPSMENNYGNGLFVGQQQQNGQRMMGQGYSNTGQFPSNLQQFPNQQQNFYNNKQQSPNYNNGINRSPIVTPNYNDPNNLQIGYQNQYNNQQNGQQNMQQNIQQNGQQNMQQNGQQNMQQNGRRNIISTDNNSHPESKWIPVNSNNGIIDQITNSTSNIWSNAKETFNTGVNKAQNVQEALGRGIQNVGSGIESIGGGFQRFGGNIETGISNMRQSISSGIDSAGQALSNFGQNTGENLQTFGQNVQQGINDNMNSMQNSAGSIHEQLRAQFNQIKQQIPTDSSYNTQPSDVNTQNNVHYLVRSQLSGQNSQNNGNYLPNSQFDSSSQQLMNYNNQNNNLSPGMAQYSQSNHNLKNPLAGY